MSLPENHIEQIDLFLNGELTGEELVNFEKSLESNQALKNELTLQMAIKEASEQFGELELKKELDHYFDEHQQNTGSPNFFKKYAWLLGGIVGVLLLTIMVINPFKKPTPIQPKVNSTADTVQENKTPVKDTIRTTIDSTTSFLDTVSSSHLTVDLPKKPTVVPDKLIKTLTKTVHIYEKPEHPGYILTSDAIQVYGNRSIDFSKAKLYRHQDGLVLQHNRFFYLLEEKDKLSRFQVARDIRSYELLKFSSGKGPQIKVEEFTLHQIQSTEKIEIEVIENGQSGYLSFEGNKVKIANSLYQSLGDFVINKLNKTNVFTLVTTDKKAFELTNSGLIPIINKKLQTIQDSKSTTLQLLYLTLSDREYLQSSN